MTTFHIVVLPVVLPQLCVAVCCNTRMCPDSTPSGAIDADVNCDRAVLAWVVRLLVTALPGPARPNIP